ncbi:hypothetical protein RclHR1_00870019 [Rhizophagus clarus]|uniref:Uncharacterized protein n=1 Tax=Rhizophagus clarus TaxID=94130 RepID=A0A2Z6S1J5_9GLOM|nr:hypothetical protein RclHR1_00870019 [Rhizophagus clarus]
MITGILKDSLSFIIVILLFFCSFSNIYKKCLIMQQTIGRKWEWLYAFSHWNIRNYMRSSLYQIVDEEKWIRKEADDNGNLISIGLGCFPSGYRKILGNTTIWIEDIIQKLR